MLWRFGIFTVLVKIQNLQQIFKIVNMSVKMLYLHWVEGTPQLCPFPSVNRVYIWSQGTVGFETGMGIPSLFTTIFLLSHSHMTVGKSCDHINLQTYNLCFVLSTLTITPTWPKNVVSHMPHNWGISIWQRTWCKSVECARIYPPVISVGVAPPPIHLFCWESFVFLLIMTVKVRASFTSSTTLFLICLVVLLHNSGVCCYLFGQPNVGYVA